mmetsp:Transcript_113045/g.324893  ORF Transcript_113045/g.324893 Transcript_113045/m.324893 type:complete len:302 (+) Transcript_113045:665-1570(+)
MQRPAVLQLGEQALDHIVKDLLLLRALDAHRQGNEVCHLLLQDPTEDLVGSQLLGDRRGAPGGARLRGFQPPKVLCKGLVEIRPEQLEPGLVFRDVADRLHVSQQLATDVLLFLPQLLLAGLGVLFPEHGLDLADGHLVGLVLWAVILVVRHAGGLGGFGHQRRRLGRCGLHRRMLEPAASSAVPGGLQHLGGGGGASRRGASNMHVSDCGLGCGANGAGGGGSDETLRRWRGRRTGGVAGGTALLRGLENAEADGVWVPRVQQGHRPDLHRPHLVPCVAGAQAAVSTQAVSEDFAGVEQQ